MAEVVNFLSLCWWFFFFLIYICVGKSFIVYYYNREEAGTLSFFFFICGPSLLCSSNDTWRFEFLSNEARFTAWIYEWCQKRGGQVVEACTYEAAFDFFFFFSFFFFDRSIVIKHWKCKKGMHFLEEVQRKSLWFWIYIVRVLDAILLRVQFGARKMLLKGHWLVAVTSLIVKTRQPNMYR